MKAIFDLLEGFVTTTVRSAAVLAGFVFLQILLLSCAQAATIFTNLATLGSDTTGFQLNGKLLQANDGNFYGATDSGGDLGYGAIFRMTPGGTLTNLANFGASDGGPSGGLIQGADGNFYGTGGPGNTGQNLGTIFQLTPAGVRTVLFTFQGTNGSVPVGLVQGADGSLYGVTLFGGTGYAANNPNSGFGTIFKFSTNGSLSTLVSFNGMNGAQPEAAPVFAADGNLYGTTDCGGTDTNLNNTSLGFTFIGQGTIYKLTPDGTFTSLASFDTNNGGGGISALMPQRDASFFGSTFRGGASGYGSVFKLTGGSNITTVASFSSAFGGNPTAFMQASDGNFYGVYRNPWSSPNPPYGAIFQCTPSGALTLAYSFANEFAAFGETLMQAADGNFYGSTMQATSQDTTESIFRLGLPLAPASQSATLSGGQFVGSWSAVAGQSYQVQYATDLTPENWTNLGAVLTATNGSVAFTDNIGPDPQRFYRVFVLP